MNARPLRRFLFKLAGHLKMTVRELESRMDSRELAEWIAFDRYYQPIGEEWLQTGYVVSAVLAPHTKKTPKPSDFVPTWGKAPQHPTQMQAELDKMRRDLGLDEDEP